MRRPVLLTLIFFSISVMAAFSQTTIAVEDFDGATPTWSFTNDVPFFNNGSDGRYGIFPASTNSNLDNTNFSGDVLFENDLDDEGDNGTSGFATVTFDQINTSTFSSVTISFDYQFIDYNANSDEGKYEVFFDGAGQGEVFLADGTDSATENTSGTVTINVPDGTNAISLEVAIRNNGSSGFSAFDNFLVTGTPAGGVVPPGNFTASTASTSQIDLSFTTNTDNDNVVIVFDSDGSFTTPSGTPPAVGQPFAGGEVLSNGTTSPVNHTGLNSNQQVFYSAFSFDGSDYSSGVTDDATTLKAEPANHATGFTATASGSSQIDLSWTDATGSPAPENYLILVNTGSITPPSDGTTVTDDTDLSDGNGALNVAQGSESANFTNLDADTQYFFKLYPYTNSGSNIDYKTDGMVPSSDATTDSFSSSLIISQYIDTGSGTTPKAIELWNVSGSAIEFSTTTLVINRYANGSSSPTEEANISSGTLADGEVMVIGGSDTKAFMDANKPSVTFIDDSFSFNGDDALEVLLDGSRQDVFGTIGNDPGSAWSGNSVSTSDQNIALLSGITSGSSTGFTDPSSRFETIVASVSSGTGDLTGFGDAPTDGGTFTITGSQGYRLLSNPISSTSFSDLLSPLWTQGATGSDAPGADASIFTWDNTSSTDDVSNWQAVSDMSNTPNSASGFLAFVFADNDPNTAAVDGGFPKTLSLSGAEHSGPVSPTVNQNANGFTLLGNPFASTIDFDELTSSDLNGTVYVWDPSVGASGDWINWDGSTGDLTDGLIAPFQGFFVENAASVTSPSVTIEAADKATGGSFRGKQTTDDPLAVRLELSGNGFVNATWLNFTENGSPAGRVRGDALQLESLNARFAQLATTKTGGGPLLDINRLPQALEETIELPVQVNSSESGTFTLTATDLTIPEGLSLSFNNLETGESQLIDENFSQTLEITANRQAKQASADGLIAAPENLVQTSDEQASAAYSITIEPNIITSVDEEGLNLPEKVQLDQNFPNPFNPTTTIRFALPESQQVSLEVYDLLGRRVAQLLRNEVRSAGTHSVNFDAASLSSGVYIYQLRAEGGATITRKLTLIK